MFRKIVQQGRVRVLVIYQEDNMFAKKVLEYIASAQVSGVLLVDVLIIRIALSRFENCTLEQTNQNARNAFLKPDAGLKQEEKFGV